MEKELRTNAKRLSSEEQYQIRKQIIRLEKSGKKAVEIAQIRDVSRRHVESTKRAYKEQGIAGNNLSDEAGRRANSECCRLSRKDTRDHHRQKPRPVEAEGVHVDAEEYSGTDSAHVWSENAAEHFGILPGALGVFGTKAAKEGI